MVTQSYVKRNLVCYATIGDSSEPYDVVQVTTDFALNAIPTATVTFALGMNTENNEASKASEIEASLFTFRKVIKIWSESPEEAKYLELGLRESEAVGPKIIFEGYIAGVGYQRNASGAALSVSVEHWLSDLAASSMMGAATHSMTPGDLQRSALLVSARAQSGASSQTTYGVLSSSWVSKQIGNSLNIVNNLWEGGIKKIAEGGANAEALIDVNRSADPDCAGQTKDINNQAALSALAKMSGTLPLKLTGAENILVGIIRDLGSLFLENLTGQTIWDVIVSASANYMFAVAPGINKATVIPFLPCLRADKPFYTIPAEQIFSVSLAGDMPRTVRGVAILFSTETGPMGKGGKETAVPPLRVGGAYIGPTNCKGTILYKQPPAWLATASATYYATGEDKDTNTPVRTGANPVGGAPTTKDSKSETIENTMQIRDDYAKSLYGFEILKGRQGTISGPFRTDIGVGSYIAFELPKDIHAPKITKTEAAPNHFRGIILKVSTTLDAQSSQSLTTFTIGYARTQVEDDGNILTMEEHPIYTETYLGGRLDNE